MARQETSGQPENHIDLWRGFFAAVPQLNIQLDGTAERLSSLMVGYLPDKYLIITTPQVTGISQYAKIGRALTVVHLFHGSVYGFETEISGRAETPARLLFIDFPSRVELYELRQHKRIAAQIPATIITPESEFSGILWDISMGGCRFVCRANQGSQPVEIDKDCDVKLEIKVLGAEEPLQLMGRIKSTKLSEGRITVGIQFDSLRNRKKIGDIQEYIHKVIEVISP